MVFFSLLGLFIWSIDLDTKPHDPLKALLGGKLDRFAKKMASKIPSMIGSPYRGPNVPVRVLPMSRENFQANGPECGSLDCPGGSTYMS